MGGKQRGGKQMGGGGLNCKKLRRIMDFQATNSIDMNKNIENKG